MGEKCSVIALKWFGGRGQVFGRIWRICMGGI
jgi:hypothetical protein